MPIYFTLLIDLAPSGSCPHTTDFPPKVRESKAHSSYSHSFHHQAPAAPANPNIRQSRDPHSFLAERCAERPAAVKGASFAAKRTLDGEDRSARIPQGRNGEIPWPKEGGFS